MIVEVIATKNSRQIIGIVSGIFMLSVITAPLNNLISEIKNFKISAHTEFTENADNRGFLKSVNQYTAESGAEAVERVIEELLAGFGVDDGEAIVNYEIDEKNSVINITSAVIQLDKRYKGRGTQIETYIFRNTNIPIEVEYKG